ncbi:positive regulation of extrinsic apoptotic signaling pathway via death domain receptors protein [Branchiostoma belcheri]|nr:positive regulation of extrinsic apoptotic signaling pathway via death domain receptors protein [Branchiostoma belcheri]
MVNGHDQTRQGQSQSATGFDTNTTDIVMASGDDHHYEDVDSYHVKARQGQTQVTTETNTKTTATVMTSDKPTSTPSVHLPVLIRSVCGSVAGIGLIGVTILAIRYWKGKGRCPLEQNAGIVGGNKNTTATALSSAHGQTGQSQANIHSVQNVFYEAPAVLTSNQFQAITESNTPANVVSSGDDHQYEDIDNHHDNRNLFNAKGLTPSAANSGHTTTTVSASSHNQTRQGQSQAINESLDARNLSYGTGQTVSNVNAGYTTANVMAIYIRALQPSLNRDGERYRLQTTFDPLLTSHVGKITCPQHLGQIAEEDCDSVDLYVVAGRGNKEKVKRLIQQGVDVNCAGFNGDTPLHCAATRGHVGVAELLLNARARVNSRNQFKESPLHCAATGGHVGVAELLLKAGAQVDSRDQDENTPLHCAALEGHLGFAELLLKAGAQVDSRMRLFDTPLHKAASRGHVGVAELLLKAGAQADSRDDSGRTPENIAASTHVQFGPKVRILEGRKKVLDLFAVEKAGRPYVHKLKVGEEGGELQTAYCTVSVPRGAVAMETEITCQVINPNDVTFPLKGGEMLVSDVIELGPHRTTLRKPVTVQMQYSSASSGGPRDTAVWVTEDRSQWTELKTTKERKGKLDVSVDHLSIFAVISQPKKDRFTVHSEGFKLTSSTQPSVQISFPEQAVDTDTQVKLEVQEVPERAVDEIKASRGLVGTTPIVKVETVSDSAVKLQKPVTVRVPHPQHYMDIQHEGPTKLRVMSRKEEGEDWIDVTDDVDIHHTPQLVEAAPESQPNQVLVQCSKDTEAEEKHAQLLQKGYTGLEPSDTVRLLQGQRIKVSLVGNVSFAPNDQGVTADKYITFHSYRKNLRQFVVKAEKDRGGLAGHGVVAFYELPHVVVTKEKGALVRRALQEGEPGGELKRPRKLCEIPIHVPYMPSPPHSPTSSQIVTPRPEDFVTSTATEGMIIADLTAEPQHARNPCSRCCMWITLWCGGEEAPGGQGYVVKKNGRGVRKYFFFIKDNVSSNWKDLSFHLGFNAADEDNIAGRNRDDKSRCMDMLQDWQKREGNKATIEVLIDALENANLRLVVDGLRDEFPGNVL